MIEVVWKIEKAWIFCPTKHAIIKIIGMVLSVLVKTGDNAPIIDWVEKGRYTYRLSAVAFQKKVRLSLLIRNKESEEKLLKEILKEKLLGI